MARRQVRGQGLRLGRQAACRRREPSALHDAAFTASAGLAAGQGGGRRRAGAIAAIAIFVAVGQVGRPCTSANVRFWDRLQNICMRCCKRPAACIAAAGGPVSKEGKNKPKVELQAAVHASARRRRQSVSWNKRACSHGDNGAFEPRVTRWLNRWPRASPPPRQEGAPNLEC
jgi:hypothetical protein